MALGAASASAATASAIARRAGARRSAAAVSAVGSRVSAAVAGRNPSSSSSSSSRSYRGKDRVVHSRPAFRPLMTTTVSPAASFTSRPSVGTTGRCRRHEHGVGTTTTTTTTTRTFAAGRMYGRRRLSSTSGAPSTSTNSASSPADEAEDVGLFSLPGLRTPPDFLRLASLATSKCDSLRNTLSSSLSNGTSADSLSNAADTLHTLDEISNTVCSVIDAAELCRNAHASAAWRESAEDAFSMLSGYIAELNGDDGLYRSLESVTDNAEVFARLNDEQRRFATLLKEEFERDGIGLPPQIREEVKEVVGHVTRLEGLFVSNVTRSRKVFDVSSDAERVIPSHILHASIPEEQRTTQWGRTTISSDAHVANALIRYSSNPGLRREVYQEINTLCPENLDVLDSLIEQRHKLATLQGYESYADRFLRDKMAKIPSAVMEFLETVRRGAEPAYQADMALLKHAKDQIETSGVEIQPWDVPFYSGILKAQTFGDSGADLGGYFTVDGVVEGMADLVRELFGIEMAESIMAESERWDVPDGSSAGDEGEGAETAGKIRKYQFTHSEEGPLGTVYLDLHPREGKYGHAAHFTVRCGCAVRSPSSDAAGGATTQPTEYQLPIVALVCNLSPPHASSSSSADGAPVSLLSHAEVETLLHEFGHALHSLLGRTSFQHLAGTRAAMDFIETPSHVVENYAWDAEFLRRVGRHYATGEELDELAIANLIRGRNAFRSLEAMNQVVHAKFDQALFGPDAGLTPKRDTTALFGRLHAEHNVPFAEGTHWHSKFGHLVTYGAGYYGYLYSQVFAADVWNTVLKKKSHPPHEKPSSSFFGSAAAEEEGDGECGIGNGGGGGGGKRLWDEVLRHGGARDPNLMLRRLLGREPSGQSFFGDLTRWRG